MKKKLAILVAGIMLFNIILLSGCYRIKFGNAGNLTYFRYFYVEKVETLQGYAECDYEFIVYEDEHNPGQVVVFLSILRSYDYSIPLCYVVQGGTEILAHIKAIFDEYNVYSWDNDKDAPTCSISRTEYFVQAVFEKAELEASSNFRGIQEKYIAGHQALSSYLRQCIETLPIQKISEQDVITGLDIALPELAFSVSDLFRENNEAPFRSIEESRQEEFRELLRDLVDLYNDRTAVGQYRIEPTAEVWASITTLDELNKDTNLMRVWTEYSFHGPYFTQDDIDGFSSRIAAFQNT